VYNIQKAVSRLDFAPQPKEVQITDIKKGIGIFTPKPDKPVSFAALKEKLKKAGYVVASAVITVSGKLACDDGQWSIVANTSEQRFNLSDPDTLLANSVAGDIVEVSGNWETLKKEPPEQISLKSLKKLNAANHAVTFMTAGFAEAPIRVTSPGLTVYKGGAIIPRIYFIKQHLGDLEVNRQVFDLSASYTPSPRVQLEIELPVSRTSFRDGPSEHSETGLGNVTLWGKYRFFRKVKTYGDRQAALRAGLELPTGKKEAPTQSQVNAPDFVRQQLTPISGGLSPHFNVSFSQAGGRFIVGGDAEAIVRTERDGFRMGHEVRVSTDSEYVLLPRKYDAPGNELFLILETVFVHRSSGRLNGVKVDGSGATEYYLAPGLQYAAAPQFVIEGSFQFPVIRNTGPLVLKNERNILMGVRYLF